MSVKGQTPQRRSSRERAIAIRYDDPLALPEVTATGTGEIARQIVQYAEELGVPIQENSQLADLLGRVGIGEVINPESFRLVAEIVSFLYHTDVEWSAKHSFVAELAAPEEP